MKGKIISYILSIFCLSPLFSMANQKEDPCHFSTEGIDFWFGIMQNRDMGDSHIVEINVTSRVGAQFTLTYGSNSVPIGGTYTVGPNQSLPISIDYNLLESLGSENIENKGIHLVSTNPVNVYALNYRTRSSDVAMIYPTESLGKEYYAICYSPRYTTSNESNSEFLIVASEDNTTIKITPARNTDMGKPANVAFSIQLNKGQSYQVQAGNTDGSGKEDLTGSYVIANKPIAFFSGSKATTIPYSGYTNYSYDHLYEQIPPTSTWGNDFYVVPLKLRSKDTYRILAAEDATTVKIEGTNMVKTLARGEYYEFDLISACRIISNRKVLLAQYCRSQKADENNGVGDPFMIIISPVVQKINDVTFVAYESSLINNIFYVNIITLTSEVSYMTLDGANIGSSFSTFPDGEYSYAQVAISKGPHRLKNTAEKGGFLAFVYGFGDNGNTESYGYGVGFNLDIQLEIVGNWTTSTPVICKGSEAKLEVGDYFDSYLWSTGDTTLSIKVSEEGKYVVKGTTSRGCVKSDSVYLKLDNPTIDLGKDTVSCNPGDIILDAGKKFITYLWQDGSTNQTFQVDSTGNYSVTGNNELGCKASDDIHVIIFSPKFSQNYKVATDEHSDISFTNQTEAAVSYSWNFGDGETSEDENPVHHYSKIGVYKVVLQATSNFGCVDTTSSIIKIIPFNLHTPNAFRPDSEIPENQVFQPILEGIDPENYQFRILNRVGSTVFETGNPETGWDGRMYSGTKAGPGIFVWIVKYKDVQGYDHLQKGTVMLVR
jgi:hypothetical protein